ncbi:MAG: DUF5710 domain-containing protein, partial [Vulcanimicrobiaceae bacterium]
MTDQASRTYLDVPYAEKDKAKRLGAKWDGERRQWFLESGGDADEFYKRLRANGKPNHETPQGPRCILDLAPVDASLFEQRRSELRSIGAWFDQETKQWSVDETSDIGKIKKWFKRNPAQQRYSRDGDELSRYLRYCDDALQQSDLNKLIDAGALHVTHDEIELGHLRETPSSQFLEKTQTLADSLLTVAGACANEPTENETEAEDSVPQTVAIPNDPYSDEERPATKGRAILPDDPLRAVFIVFGRSWKRADGKKGWNTLVAVPAAMSDSGALHAVGGQLPLFNVEFFEPQEKKREPILGDVATLEKTLSDASNFAGGAWTQYVAWFDALFSAVVGERHASVKRIRDFLYRFKPFDVRIAPYSRNDSMVAALRDLYVAASLADRRRIALLESLYVGRTEPKSPLSRQQLRKEALSHTGHMGSKFGLDPSQRLALRHLLATPEASMLAVSGPPGTGKTSMLQSVIATLVVNSAVTKETLPPVIIASSATNQAVTNIIKAFATIGEPYGDAQLQARWIPDVPSYGWYFPSKSKADSDDASAFQQLLRHREQNLWTFGGTATDFQNSRIANPDFSGLRIEYLDKYRTVFPSAKAPTLDEATDDIRARLRDLIGSNRAISLKGALDTVASLDALVDLAPLHKRLVALDKVERYEKRMTRIGTYEAVLKQRASEAQNAVWHFAHGETPAAATFRDLLGALLDPRRWSSVPAIVKRMIAPAEQPEDPRLAFLKEERATLQRRLDRFLLRRSRIEGDEPSKTLIPGIQEILSYLGLLESIAREFLAPDSAQRWILGLRIGLGSDESDERDPDFAQGYVIGKMVAGREPNGELEDALDGLLDRTIRARCFHFAARYWEGRWLLEADKTIDGSDEQAVVAALRRLCMLAPVVVATANTLPNLLRIPGVDDEPDDFAFSSADLLILDEAGQVAPPVAVALFSLAKRCLTVGDVRQLAPIVGISESQDNSLLRLHGFEKDIRALRAAGLATVKGSIMLAAQSASHFGGGGTDITLLRHYRCRPSIIEFCNELVYKSTHRLIPMTEEPEQPLYHPMSYVELDFGSRQPSGGSRENDGEAREIVEWLAADRERIEAHYNCSKDGRPLSKDDPKYRDLRQLVALITPFAAQKQKLSQLVKATFSFGAADENDSETEREKKMVIGTVHALQGAERPIVIFSPVNAPTDGVQPFMDNSTDMLNVAVSRAQDVFVLFGSRELFFSRRALMRSNRAPSATLGRYMREYGKHLYPRILVVVESPNKVDTLQAVLGKRCKVLATSGHFREIADIDFDTMTARWTVIPDKEARIREIHDALDDMDELVLATDDDQEGEAIAWHVLDALNGMRAMDGVRVTRMTFHEVTAAAISEGFARRSGPWRGSRRADAALTRALIDRVLGESLTLILTTAMNERSHAGSHGMGRVRAALLELLERNATDAGITCAVRGELRVGDVALSGHLVRQPTDFEPFLAASKDEAEAFL